MKARARRPSAFIVSRCLDAPMKHEDIINKDFQLQLFAIQHSFLDNFNVTSMLYLILRFLFRLVRFLTFRRVLDAEMKEAT